MPQLNKTLNEILSVHFTQEELKALVKKSGHSINSIPEELLKKNVVEFAGEKFNDSQFCEFLNHLGEYDLLSGNYESCIGSFKKVINLSENSLLLEGFQAKANIGLGEIYSRIADWNKSIKYLNRAKEIYSGMRDFDGNAYVENILGTIWGERGRIKKAKEHFYNCIDHLDEKKNENLFGMVEINLGIINIIQGNYDDAHALLQRASFKFEKHKNPMRMAEIKNNFAVLFTKKHEYKKAAAAYEESIAFAETINYAFSISISLTGKAYLYTLMMDLDEAEAFLSLGMKKAAAIKDDLSLAELYKIAGMILFRKNDFVNAEKQFLISIQKNKEFKSLINETETLIELADLYIAAGDTSKAESTLATALSNAKKGGVPALAEEIKAKLNSLK